MEIEIVRRDTYTEVTMYLKEKGNATVGEVSDFLGISRRSAFSQLNFLAKTGYAIKTEGSRSPKGGNVPYVYHYVEEC